MPIKFKPSEKIYDRDTRKTLVRHHWMKGTSTKDLLSYINNPNSKKKKINKCQKEINRRMM
jgi:hypothetical protein